MRIGEYETHPAADIFPLIDGDEFDALVEDIRAHGQREPIWRTYIPDPARKGQRKALILDGRNRLRACIAAKRKPEFRDYEGEDPVGIVISLNVNRRHLDESQRAIAAAKAFASKVPGFPNLETSAAVFRVGKQSVYHALDVLGVSREPERGGRPRADTAPRKGAPEVVAAVERGEIAVSAGAKLAKLPLETQREVIRQAAPPEPGPSEAAARPKKIVKGTQIDALVKKAERREVAQRIEAEPPPMPLGPFRVIALDYAWPYEVRAEDDTQRGKLDYPPMSLVEIERHLVHEVERLVHPDGTVLHFWTTNAFLPDSYRLLAAAGWRYRITRVWDKVLVGLGNTYRNVVEFCIVATKGDPPIHVTNETTLMREPRRAHSQKPEVFYRDVEATCPGSKVELFARTQRVGWTTWGAEVGKFDPVLDVDASTAAAQDASPEASPDASRVDEAGRVAEALQDASHPPATSGLDEALEQIEADRAEAAAIASEPSLADQPCLDCDHPECPIVPDCSGCPTCASERIAREQPVADEDDDATDEEAVAAASSPSPGVCTVCEHPRCPALEGVDCPICVREGALEKCVVSTKAVRAIKHGKGVVVTCADCDQTWIAGRDPVLEVPCATCHVPKGTKCKKPSGHGFPGGGFHVGRDRDAHAARAYHPDCTEWRARDPQPEKPAKKGKAPAPKPTPATTTAKPRRRTDRVHRTDADFGVPDDDYNEWASGVQPGILERLTEERARELGAAADDVFAIVVHVDGVERAATGPTRVVAAQRADELVDTIRDARSDAPDDDEDAFERGVDAMAKSDPDARIEIRRLSAARAHALKAAPDHEWEVRIEWGLGSVVGNVSGVTQLGALEDARKRLAEMRKLVKPGKGDRELAIELRQTERVIEEWRAKHGGVPGRVVALPDRSFQAVLGAGKEIANAFAPKPADAFRIASEKFAKAAAKKGGKR